MQEHSAEKVCYRKYTNYINNNIILQFIPELLYLLMLNFLQDILRFDSTSGSENELARYIFSNYKPEGTESELQETGYGRLNVLFKTGEPKVVFCSHLDTVPPYIAPTQDDKNIYGRGSCDAKGQIAYLFEVFKQLISEGHSNIGMLVVSGEEDGSQGAIAANKRLNKYEYIFIGEPTENKLIKASKGNLLVNLNFKGESCHSGYPDIGDSAFDRMMNFFKSNGNLKNSTDTVIYRVLSWSQNKVYTFHYFSFFRRFKVNPFLFNLGGKIVSG